MKIAGLIKNSLIDYPGQITAIVFTQGCNFRCPYCHNPDLVDINAEKEFITEREVFEFLKKRKGLLEAVTITGGEPTLQKDLKEFIKKIKGMGYLVKLDTNGTNPAFLEEILSEGNVDYLAMDIKNTPEKYAKVSGPVDVENIKKSIGVIMGSGLDYEFRTTVMPRHHKAGDFEEIGKMIKGANKYFIQNFRADCTLNKTYVRQRSFTKTELEDIKKTVGPYVKSCSLRENE